MSMTRNPAARDVLNQIVMDPRYAEVTRVPVFSIPQIMLSGVAFGLFALATVGYLGGSVPLWLAMLVNIVAVYLAFTPLHDASHRAVSKNGFLNDLIGTVIGQLLLPGINMPAFRTIHMDHHRYVGQEGRDPDTAFVTPPKPFGVAYLMFADVHWALWYLKYGRHLWSRKAGLYIGLLLFCLIGSHVTFLLSPWWKEFLLLYVVPQRIGLGIIAYTFAHIQHPEGLTWDKEPFQSTVYVRGQSPFRRLMFGQEEHIIHHLTPHVPWFKYKRVWDLANGVLWKQGIPARGWFEGPGAIAVPGDDARAPVALKVAALEDVAPGIRQVRFEARDGKLLSPATAGSHIDVHLPDGLVRQYSVVDSNDAHYTIAVKLEEKGRGGSRAIHALKLGDVVPVGKPRNNFVLYESAPRFVLVAGGIGITPILSMACRLIELGKPFELHLCTRDLATAPFKALLSEGPLAEHSHIHPDRADGTSGVDLDAVLKRPSDGATLYLCGPQGFMEHMRAQAVARRWDKAAIRTESFSAAIADDAPLHPFTLTLAKSGQSLTVGVEETVIDALAKIGVDVPFACMQGTCGTCLTPVSHGDVAHFDAYLSEEDKASMNRMCLCVSRAKGDAISIEL